MQKQTEGYPWGDHGPWVQWHCILTARAMWRARRLNPRKAPCPAEGSPTGTNTGWASRDRWAYTEQDGARSCCCLCRGGGTWFSPSLSCRLASGAIFSMAFFPRGRVPAQHWACGGGSHSRDMSLGLRDPLSARQAASLALLPVWASLIIPQGL